MSEITTKPKQILKAVAGSKDTPIKIGNAFFGVLCPGGRNQGF